MKWYRRVNRGVLSVSEGGLCNKYSGKVATSEYNKENGCIGSVANQRPWVYITVDGCT